MSYQVAQACYPTAESAASASASHSLGTIVQRGDEPYAVNASSVTGTTITYTLTPLGGGTPITTSTPYTAQPCQLLTIGDGIQMGWMVAGAWIGAYCLMFLGRMLRGETGDTYGNT